MGEIVFFAAVGVIVFWYIKFLNAVIANEKAQYDDSDCSSGSTNYPGPM
jgi:hypothetical protein